MDIKQLRYFVAIADRGSLSSAAAALHVAQSALSRMLQMLEEELGGELFDRGARGVVLSEAGKVLLPRARFILNEIESARIEVLANNRELQGNVRLGAPSGISQILYAPLAHRFLSRFPKVRLQLTEGLHDLTERLIAGAIDVAIVSDPRQSAHLEYSYLFTEPILLIGPAGDPRLAQTSVPMERILDLPLILSSRANWLQRIQSQFGDRYRDLQTVLEVDSATPLKSLVAAGHGYGLVPASVFQGDTAGGRLAASTLEGFGVTRVLAFSRGRPVSRALRELIAAVKNEVEKLTGQGLLKTMDEALEHH